MTGLVLLWGALAWAAPQEAYGAGVTALRAGEYDAAVAHFEAALAGGGVDPAVYHGLGNALYRQQRRGAAMAAWARGQVLAPGDGDLAANLARARGEVTDALPPPERWVGPFFWRAWLSLRAEAILASLLATVGLTILAAGTARRTAGWGWLLGGGGLAVAGGLLATSAVLGAQSVERTAVVVVPAVTAQSTLDGRGVELFTLHEGSEVWLLETDAGAEAELIALSDGRKGWVPSRALISTGPADPFPMD